VGKLNGIALPGYRIKKDGTVVKCEKHSNLITKLRQKDSKKVRVARKGQA
jgi:hypothetical protein